MPQVRSPEVTAKSRKIFVGAALFAAIAGTASAQMRPLTPVTDAMILNPAPADWLSWRRTLNQWGYSPLEQINQKNVAQLSPDTDNG